MHRSTTLIALRFIAYIGHLFATLLFTVSRVRQPAQYANLALPSPSRCRRRRETTWSLRSNSTTPRTTWGGASVTLAPRAR